MELDTDYSKKRFIHYLNKDEIPKEYKCSSCNSSSLYFKSDFLKTTESKESIEKHNYHGWCTDEVSLIFSGILSCKVCNESHAISGIGFLERDYNEYESNDYIEVLIPKYINPTLDIFKIPSNTPDKLKEIIKSSFSLAWSDYPAAGNRLRVALEVIIDNLIPSTNTNDSLGNKINKIPQSNSDIQKVMKAIKWLGNEASHDAELIECDLAFAFEATEFILNKLYPDADKAPHILSQAEQINKNKGSFIK